MTTTSTTRPEQNKRNERMCARTRPNLGAKFVKLPFIIKLGYEVCYKVHLKLHCEFRIENREKRKVSHADLKLQNQEVGSTCYAHFQASSKVTSRTTFYIYIYRSAYGRRT